MKPSTKPRATEERLDEIRRVAAEAAAVPGSLPSSSSPSPYQTQDSYYGLPVLKRPLWTWEVPLYFFLGGISGLSACIGFAGHLFHADPALVRTALWMALIGASICPGLLIADLGRPGRFLNMLRVFKLRSPMSMGAWILVAFSGCVFLAVASDELILRGYVSSSFWMFLRWTGESTGAVTGLLLASYTGVLIGATAVPVWSQNREILPPHFLTSGLGSAAGILEFLGFLVPATQILGFVASGLETVLAIFLEIRSRPVDAPLEHGKSGWTLRIASLLEGPASLLLRVFLGGTPKGRYAAAICFIVGALISRYGWIWAGQASAADPHALFELQHKI
jgi:formate-dependent nitrite reductase membrane component NrfD